MKKKYLVTSLAAMAILMTGTLGINQAVNANEPTTIESKKDLGIPAFKSAYLVHYNVLRIELEKPFNNANSYMQLQYGDFNQIGSSVVDEDGAVIAFDINLDEFAKSNPTTESKELIVNSLHFRYIMFTGDMLNEEVKIKDEFVQKTLLNAEDQGSVLGQGKVDVVNNLNKLESYSKVIKQDAYGDHLLKKKITTQTGAIGFKVNEEYKDTYDFSVIDAKGKVSGKVEFHNDDMFVKPEGKTFNSKEYTIIAKNKKNGTLLNIAKFTPFNLF